jgi:hypothetical protein
VVPTRFEFHPMLRRLYRNSNQFIEAFDEGRITSSASGEVQRESAHSGCLLERTQNM